MTDLAHPSAPGGAWQRADWTTRRLKKRRRADRRFRVYGLIAIFVALAMLAILLGSVVIKGYPAFVQSKIALEIYFDPQLIDPDGTGDVGAVPISSFSKLLRESLFAAYPEVTETSERRELLALPSRDARFELRDAVADDPSLIGTRTTVWLTAASNIDMLRKGAIRRDVPETERILSDRQVGWVDDLEASGAAKTVFNTAFFVNADSRLPEVAGIGGALIGSFYTLLITLVLAFPIGVTAAVYLEEFAPKNRFTDFIEVNINNLAAVPSIVFGLLGLYVFLEKLAMPRSAALVGGLTLMLMTLPTIVIAARSALASVRPSIREAAYGMGASPIQVVVHHVLPLAIPGILTGTIIGMARALGETAPLLMIGMVGFIGSLPGGPLDPATVLPVQIFVWADSPERGFVEKTSAAILVLLVFLILMNAIAILLRRKYQIRW